MGRILRDYGEESNWRLLQKKILQARLQGGLHSTGELVDVIRSVTPGTRGRFPLHSFNIVLCFSFLFKFSSLCSNVLRQVKDGSKL